ncbi:MAG: hypothetical protein ABIA47_03660 [bacterium]
MNKAQKLKIKKYFPMILFFIVCFLASNVVGIERGPCASSPCGDFAVNQSQLVTEEPVYDAFIDSVSNPFVAPASLLLSVLPLDKTEIEFWGFVNQRFDLDDAEGVDRIAMQENDIFWMPILYVLFKIIVLLSIAWWYLVWALMKRSTILSIIVWTALVAALLANGLNLFVMEDTGAYTYTWRYLTGQIEVIE